MTDSDPYRHAPHDAESAREMRRVLVDRFERSCVPSRHSAVTAAGTASTVLVAAFGWVSVIGYSLLVDRVGRASAGRDGGGAFVHASPGGVIVVDLPSADGSSAVCPPGRVARCERYELIGGWRCVCLTPNSIQDAGTP